VEGCGRPKTARWGRGRHRTERGAPRDREPRLVQQGLRLDLRAVAPGGGLPVALEFLLPPPHDVDAGEQEVLVGELLEGLEVRDPCKAFPPSIFLDKNRRMT
jgi:hypothetical protein